MYTTCGEIDLNVSSSAPLTDKSINKELLLKLVQLLKCEGLPLFCNYHVCKLTIFEFWTVRQMK